MSFFASGVFNGDGPECTRPLPVIATQVDAEIARIDGSLRWLSAVSPLVNDGMWERFKESGYRNEPQLHYSKPRIEAPALRKELESLPIDEVEPPLVRALLAEKQRECSLFCHLIEMRGTSGALATSIELFGGVEAHLLELAHEIVDEVKDSPASERTAGFEQVEATAREMYANYLALYPDFPCRLKLDDDLNSQLMVENGCLHVARSIRIEPERIEPLLAHEIGTHVVTYENGRKQPLKQLKVGLSSYDETQEGLGALSEYLAGYLPHQRLRILAARVLAVDMVLHGSSVVSMVEMLVDRCKLSHFDAFDVAVRVARGGGLTKDVVYLRGLCEILSYLRAGGDFQALFLGKFALSQLPLLEELMAQGWVVKARVLPLYLRDQAARTRLERARGLKVSQLYQTEPEFS
jgi:uncharacterized protein (TIGR02421 family)